MQSIVEHQYHEELSYILSLIQTLIDASTVVYFLIYVGLNRRIRALPEKNEQYAKWKFGQI